MAYDETPGAGAMFRLDTGLSASTIFTGATISNGLEWSPDGQTAYYVDSATHRVDLFDYDPEQGLLNRRPLVHIDSGVPDGLTVDGEGHVWVALYGGYAVRRYRPDGALDGVVEVPCTNVTACTFGGANLDELFITTSREGVPDGAQPQAGSVFRCVPGVRGRAVRAFAG